VGISWEARASAPSSLPVDGDAAHPDVKPSEDQLGRFRARQIHTVLQLTPLTVTANLVNVGLLLGMFWRGPWMPLLCAWSLGVLPLIYLGLRAWLRGRRRKVLGQASARVERHAVRHAVLLSSFWAVIPAVLMSECGPGEQGLLGCVCVAMICAGGFALATIPRAGMSFALILGCGTAVGLLRSSALPAPLLLTMLGLYVATVVMSVRWTAHSFRARLLAEVTAERQRDLVGLLLHDFEAHASDALWEADAEGRFSHVSQRLSDMLGVPVMHLVGRRLDEVFDDGAAAADDSIELNGDAADATLRQRLKTGRPFHDLVLSFGTRSVGGDARSGWVQLAAKPLADVRGQHSGWRGVASNITVEHEAQLHVTKLAFMDSVTGLANRHSFQIRLGQMVAQEGAARACAVICMDLDGFKTVNDALGHDIGDGLLRSVAERLSALLLPRDVFARIGGDEFGFILDGVGTEEEAAGRAALLLQALRAPLEVKGASVPIGASLGVALVPQDGHSADLVMKNADLALYAAKGAGRGQYRFYQAQMGSRVHRRLQVERALREALQKDQLSLAFQPQLDLATGELSGFEALLRWHHPELGHVSPADFVPVAEDAGLIIEIGAWVLRRACAEASGWRRPLRVAVNLSPLQIMAQDLQAEVQQALQSSGLPARRLELEVTESVLLNETPATLAQLHGIHQLGARIALDDFGTGYSSMAYLRRFPFDKLKIDRAFVGELVDRSDARAIVRAMLELGSALRMETVAEGVETLEELQVLRWLGCGAAQGYLVARPMPAADVAAFIASWHEHPLRAAVLEREPADDAQAQPMS
jgi:diguanylate cyclase (GGDEF)-like protein